MQDEELRTVVNLLSNIEGWLRFENVPRLKSLLEQELDEPRKRLSYENSDGKRSLREVARLSGVPFGTLSGWWDRWFTLGIANESPFTQGRMGKICSLKSLGIDVPKATGSSETSSGDAANSIS